MANPARPHQRGVRLSDEELWLCNELSKRKGIDVSGVFRMYMLQGAHDEGLVYPGHESTGKKKNPPKR